VLVVVALWLAYLFVATAGTWVHLQNYTTFYDFLAEGFRSGHLHLSVSPPDVLTQSGDPFGPLHRDLWIWDASYYNGKYYIYWGPLPALVQAAVKSLLRISHPVGDEYAAFSAYSLYLVCGAVLLVRIWRRLFNGISRTLLWLGIVAFAFGHPTPYLVASGAVYEAAIAGGQVFLLAGLIFAFDAVWLAQKGTRSSRRLIAAGVLWAMALACRISIGLAVPLLIVGTAVFVTSPTEPKWRCRLRNVAQMGMPVLTVVLLLLAYNKARFAGWFDFGVRHQLTTNPFHAALAYVPANLYSDLLRPMRVSCDFPYFFPMRWAAGTGFPRWLLLQQGYSTAEALIGFLVALPLAWLCPIAVILGSRGALRNFGVQPNAASDDPQRDGRAFCTLSFSILATFAGLPTLVQFIATMRYLGDSSAGVVLLGILAVWSVILHVKRIRVWPRVVTAFGVLLMVASIGLGAALGTEGYYDDLRTANPTLFRAIARPLSLCARPD
jgi:hypothetical protein